MARVTVAELVGRAVGGDADALMAQRQRGAHKILERLQAYPAQWEAIQEIAAAKFSTLQANRGGGKTEGVVSWALARCIARDGYVVRLGCSVLEAPTDNVLDRQGYAYSTLGWIQRLGLADHVRVSRVAGRAIKRIAFSWGSVIYVHDLESVLALERKRGNTAHLWIFDEAQSLQLLSTVMSQLVIPRLADYDGHVVMMGTPGRDIGTMFHRSSTGRASDSWTRVHYYSWDNVLHGDDDATRWTAVLRKTVEPARKMYGLSESDLATLRSLTHAERVELAQGGEPERLQTIGDDGRVRSWVEHLDPDLQREILGRWVENGAEFLFRWQRSAVARYTPDDFFYASCGPFWEDEPEHPSRCLWQTSAPIATTIAERVALLPEAVISGRARPATWQASLGVDIGSAKPSALILVAYAVGVPCAYVLWSETEAQLADGEIFDRILWVLREAAAAGVAVHSVIADINGMRGGTGKEWDRGLRQRLPRAIPIREAYKVDEDSQMLAINLDISEGRLRAVCGDALDICARHLRWKPHDPANPGPAQPDLGREVTLPDDARCWPGNHATDALRYACSVIPLLMTTAAHRPKPMTATESAVWLHEREAHARPRR